MASREEGSPAPPLDLAALLGNAQSQVLVIRRRHFALDKITRELERVSRGKRFIAWNDVVWWMLADHHHVLVTELASWARSLWEGGGLFGQLQAHHLGGFPEKRQWRLPREDEGLKAYLDRNHSAARARLFEKASGALKPLDVTDLKDRFCTSFTPLVEERHARVHVYERSAPMIAKMLDVREVGVLVEGASRMLNDLSLVALGSTHEKSELNFVNTEENAEDLADEVLIGTRIRQRIVMAGLDRNAYYEALHRFHDAASGVECFNDMSIEDAVRKERGET